MGQSGFTINVRLCGCSAQVPQICAYHGKDFGNCAASVLIKLLKGFFASIRGFRPFSCRSKVSCSMCWACWKPHFTPDKAVSFGLKQEILSQHMFFSWLVSDPILNIVTVFRGFFQEVLDYSSSKKSDYHQRSFRQLKLEQNLRRSCLFSSTICRYIASTTDSHGSHVSPGTVFDRRNVYSTKMVEW